MVLLMKCGEFVEILSVKIVSIIARKVSSSLHEGVPST